MLPSVAAQQELYELAVQVGIALRTRKQTLSIAESCTGGWVAKVITDVSGSSNWFDRGFVTYSNAAKVELLGVQEATIERHGAVSAEVVAEMVSGALLRSSADHALAITGIAGPEGGCFDKPVGTVYLAWGRRDDAQHTVEQNYFTGNRDAVRLQAVAAALRGVLDALTCPS